MRKHRMLNSVIIIFNLYIYIYIYVYKICHSLYLFILYIFCWVPKQNLSMPRLIIHFLYSHKLPILASNYIDSLNVLSKGNLVNLNVELYTISFVVYRLLHIRAWIFGNKFQTLRLIHTSWSTRKSPKRPPTIKRVQEDTCKLHHLFYIYSIPHTSIFSHSETQSFKEQIIFSAIFFEEKQFKITAT